MSLKDIAEDFCENTSCHSLDRVGDGQRRCWVRVIWFLIFITCVSVLLSQLVQLVVRYRKHDVIVDTVLEFRELPVPAVTVCNMNVIPKSKIPKNSVMETFYAFYNKLITENFLNISFCDSQPTEQRSFCEELMNLSLLMTKKSESNDVPFRKVLQWQNALEITLPIIVSQTEKIHLDNFAVSARRMLLDCAFGNCGCLNLATGFFSNQYGMCVTVMPPENHKAQASGSVEGLNMLLDVDFQDYMTTTDSVGVKVFVHHPNKHHDMESSPIYASVGRRTAVALKLVNTTKLGTPYGKCRDQTDLLKEEYHFSGDYSISGCMKTCLQKKVVRRCGCFVMGYGTPELKEGGMRYCWHDALNCAFEVQQNSTDNNEITLAKCGCSPPCHNTQYVAAISSVEWPSSHSVFSNLCFAAENNCTEMPSSYHKENTLKLEVFYDTLNYNQYIERPDYTLVDLFTDFGGNLGLFLGASVCTCCEAISFTISVFFYFCGSKKKNVEKKYETVQRSPLNTTKCHESQQQEKSI